MLFCNDRIESMISLRSCFIRRESTAIASPAFWLEAGTSVVVFERSAPSVVMGSYASLKVSARSIASEIFIIFPAFCNFAVSFLSSILIFSLVSASRKKLTLTRSSLLRALEIRSLNAVVNVDQEVNCSCRMIPNCRYAWWGSSRT